MVMFNSYVSYVSHYQRVISGISPHLPWYQLVSTKTVPDLTEQVVVAASVTIWPVRGIRIASEHSECWGRMVSRNIRDTGIAWNSVKHSTTPRDSGSKPRGS